MMNGEPLIRFEGVTVALGGRRLLDGLSWELREGECAVILGPSGGGKTVFLHTLLGLHPPVAGRVETPGLAGELFGSLAVMFQEDALLDDRPVEANLALAREERADLFGPPFRPETDRAIDDVLREVRLDPARVRPRLPATLSGGERRRVALARALIRRPRVLLADEPTSGLDPGSAAAIYELLGELIRRHGMSAVIISHDPACASRLGRPVYYFSPVEGRLPQWETPPENTTSIGGDGVRHETRHRAMVLWMEEQIEAHLTRQAREHELATRDVDPPAVTGETPVLPPTELLTRPVEALGRAGEFLGHLANWPSAALWGHDLWVWGARTLPLVALIFLMLGIVIEIQSESAVVDYGLSNRLPELVALSLLRLAPILTGFILAGRSGSGISAEVGWMQLGGQFRALRTLRIAPERTFFPPLFWALTLALPLLALAGLACGAAGALLVLASPVSRARITLDFFWSAFPAFLRPMELGVLVIKAALMGGGLAMIAFAGAAQPKRSTADVTRAMTGGLVIAFLWTTLVDTVLSFWPL